MTENYLKSSGHDSGAIMIEEVDEATNEKWHKENVRGQRRFIRDMKRRHKEELQEAEDYLKECILWARDEGVKIK